MASKVVKGLTEFTPVRPTIVEHRHPFDDIRRPTDWYLGEVLHQYNEIYMYHSFMSQETDPRIRQLWELHLDIELGQLQAACQLMRQHENREPAEFLPKILPKPTLFEENKQFVRQVLESQIGLTASQADFLSIEELPMDHRYYAYQAIVNAGGWVPSEAIIAEHCKEYGGKDWREESDGPNPVTWLRQENYGSRSNESKQTIVQPSSYYEQKALTTSRK